MTVTVKFTQEEEARIKKRAAAECTDVEAFVHEAAIHRATLPTLDEILAPIHAETERMGMTEEEIERFVDRAVEEARAERRARKSA
jgi:hypothetical protein